MKQAIAAAIFSAFLITDISEACARMWKPSRAEQAREYLQIDHSKSEEESVFLIWIAPSMIENSQENKEVREALSKYAMFLLVHNRMTSLGEFAFVEHSDLVIETGGGEIRRPILDDELPPIVATIKFFLSKTLAGGMGRVGEHARTYAFDGQGIDDCKKGDVWVNYAGERYHYETPIPGCE